MSDVALVVPPGWTLHPGGPHIGVALLKGFLQRNDISTSLHDFNLGSVEYFGIGITEDEVCRAFNNPTVTQLNALYFNAEDQLEQLARRFNGTWKAHDGFERSDCDVAVPSQVQEFSRRASPFTEYFKQKAIPQLIAESPLVIGFNIIAAPQLLPTFELIRLIRKAGYDGKIVIGGNTISRIAPDMCLDWVFDLIDGVFVYQGEKALLELVCAVRQGKELSCVTNLIWRQSGRFVTNKQATLTPDQFAPPNFDGLPVGRYWGAKYLTMIAARVCYYGKCSFCAIPHGWGPRKFIGSSPAQEVLQNVADLINRYKIPRFKFIDEAMHPKMLLELARLRSDGEIDFEFEAYLRLERSIIEPGFAAAASRAGLRKAYIGLELAPCDKRSLLAKSDGADPDLALRQLHDAGIKTHIFCLLGYPGTGIEEALKTIEFVLEHRAMIDTLDVFPFYYARHTTVAGIRPVIDPGRGWAVDHPYVPADPSVLSQDRVRVLASRMSDVVWSEQPEWFHPIYRMYSPWYQTKQRVTQDWSEPVGADLAA